MLGEPELPHAADVKFETALVLWPQPNPRIVHEQAQDDVAGTWRHDPRLRAVQTKPRALKSLPCPAHDGGGSAPNLYRQPVNLTLPHEQAFASTALAIMPREPDFDGRITLASPRLQGDDGISRLLEEIVERISVPAMV